MIKAITLTSAIIFTNLLLGQESQSSNENPFSKWSVEFNAGQNKAIRPFSEGYYSSNPDKYFNFSGINHYNIGTRYMLSEIFGLKLDFAYDRFYNLKNSGSLPFDSKSYRMGLQGVINMAKILKFDSFTKRISLLGHAGIQVSKFYAETNHLNEDNGGIMIGVTPQYLLWKNRLSLTIDFTAISNVRQHFNWDGSFAATNDNLTGLMYSTSIGLTYYLNNRKVHADWFFQESLKKNNVDKEARKRLDEIETLMKDTDKDGVPDYLDSENNTPAGVAVDTRGKIIDLNKNNVPDELEHKAKRKDQDFDYEISNAINDVVSKKLNALKTLIENKYINIFFDVNQDTPNSASTNSINQIYLYLTQYPESKIKLIGYADKTGPELKNKKLSYRRAKKLKRLFIELGINESRIIIIGNGEDKLLPSSKTGLDLARRVSVEVIK